MTQTGTAFVFGGSCGIGAAIARRLLRDGVQVVIFSRSDPRAKPGLAKAEWHALDFTQPTAAHALIHDCVATHRDTLDAVFYSSVFYGNKRADFLEAPAEEWHQQLDVNLNGLWLAVRETLPVLQQREQALLCSLSSEVVYNGGPQRSGYAATKSAAASLMRSLVQEGNGQSVRIVELLPVGMVDTAGIRKRRPADFDYSGYMDAAAFEPIAHTLYATKGAEHHGAVLVIDGEGHTQRIDEGTLPSQSRR